MIRNNSNLQTINNSLRDEVSTLKLEVSKTKKDKEELISIDPGDKAINRTMDWFMVRQRPKK